MSVEPSCNSTFQFFRILAYFLSTSSTEYRKRSVCVCSYDCESVSPCSSFFLLFLFLLYFALQYCIGFAIH